MAREFKIKLSDDLSEADIYLAIRERANELMMEGNLRCWLKIEVEAVEDEIIEERDKHILLTDIKDYIDNDINKGNK